ncbi:MAG: hypothetical protein GY792_06460 [Gammaproteobacteria bacterium]|nr:hypothetical protein [Gammaproteobacteria bacterium]
MNQLKIDDLDAPWFVIEETDDVFSGNTNRQLCYQSDFGPVQICLNSIQSIPRTHRRQRMAHLMAAAPVLYAALWELFQLLEQREPPWYWQRHHELAHNALSSAEPPEENRDVT